MKISQSITRLCACASPATLRLFSLALALNAPLVALAQAADTAAAPAAAAIQSKILMRTQNSWDGKPLHFKGGAGEVSALYIEIPPGQQTGWHQHPVPNFAYMLDGELEVSLKDGRTNRVRAGEALAEVVNVLHNGRNPSATQAAKLVVFYMGAVGIPLTIAAPAAPDQ